VDSFSIGIIISLGFLLLASAFFSASETAFSSLNRIKIKNLAGQGNKRAALVLRLVENYDRLLSTVLIGNNVVNISSSALGTVLFVGFFGKSGVSLATLVMTVLVLLFGEISPKTLAKENPEGFALAASPLLRVLMVVFDPVNRLCAHWKGFILKIFRIRSDRSVTEAELLTFVEEVRQEGGLNQGEEDLIRQAIEFDDLTANDIYTPRVDIAAVSLEDSLDSITRKFFDTGYSRLPVFAGSVDNIIGVILLKDFFYQVINQKHSLEHILKPAVFVTKSIKISSALKILQEKKSHMAVLVDEFGGTVGIITMDDIVEELVGEIWDEHEKVVTHIIPQEDGAYKILGSTGLKEFFDFFSLREGEEKPGALTVGGWVIENLAGAPREGDHFVFKDLAVKVLKTLRHRVLEILVTRLPGGQDG
jgi:CBS domain containing-hemolysin-like protein